MKSARPIQRLLVLQALWECITSLSTFAGQLGATFVARISKGRLTTDLYSMNRRCGRVLFVLAAVYLLIASDPVTINLVIAVLLYLRRPVSLEIVAA